MNKYRMRFAPGIWKPSLSPSIVSWLRTMRMRQCDREVRIRQIDVTGDDIVRRHLDAGDGVMIMPNHCSHADPYMIYAAADGIGTCLHLMATWHVFHDKSRLVQWLLQKHGCFSVDREANDIGAFKLASGILQNEVAPLVVFPEGEIYHCADRVTPFREGAAAIAVAAARKAKRKIVCVPCAIRYRYIDDPTECLTKTMGELEAAIFWRPRTDRPLVQRIYQFAEALLAVKELEYIGETRSGRLPERIRFFGDHVLDAVELRHDLAANEKSIPERVKAARKTILEKQAAEDLDDATALTLNHDLEDLFLVVQSFSYPGDYLVDEPSIERLAETIDKFEEDVLDRVTASIKAERSASIRFGEAVEVVGDKKIPGQTATITSEIERRVQAMLDGGVSE